MKKIRVLGRLEPTLLWDGDKIYDDRHVGTVDVAAAPMDGAAATIHRSSTTIRMLRDFLGLNKLFWAESGGGIDVASRPYALVDEGHAFDDINAFPRGVVLDVEAETGRAKESSLSPVDWPRSIRRSGDSIAKTAALIRDTVHQYLEALAATYPDADVYVCMSGGLDSSGIAAATREYWPETTAISFDLDSGGGASEDRKFARRLSREWRMPLLEATVTRPELLDNVDTVLREGVDWRDFNLHAGLVNAALASAIQRNRTDPSVPCLVLTGDLANELLVDYHEERYRDRTYYALPRIAPSSLQQVLISGLDSVHREIGVFGAWGVTVVQPFAVAARHFLTLPETFLSDPEAKRRLNAEMFGAKIPAYIYERPKVRAQIGNEQTGGGVLAACIDVGIDQAWLESRFAELHAAQPASLAQFIRGGRYRSAVPSLESN